MHLFWKENSNFRVKEPSRKLFFPPVQSSPGSFLSGWAQPWQSLKNNQLCFWNGAQVLYSLLWDILPTPPPWHLRKHWTGSCVLRPPGFGRRVLAYRRINMVTYIFNRILIYNIIRKMATFPYFLVLICCAKSLCHDCFMTLGWSAIHFNMLKITSKLKIELSVIYSEVDYYRMQRNKLHEAVQLTIYLCIFFLTKLVINKSK